LGGLLRVYREGVCPARSRLLAVWRWGCGVGDTSIAAWCVERESIARWGSVATVLFFRSHPPRRRLLSTMGRLLCATAGERGTGGKCLRVQWGMAHGGAAGPGSMRSSGTATAPRSCGSAGHIWWEAAPVTCARNDLWLGDIACVAGAFWRATFVVAVLFTTRDAFALSVESMPLLQWHPAQ